jgi:hypothetical protein
MGKQPAVGENTLAIGGLQMLCIWGRLRRYAYGRGSPCP